MPSSTQPWWQRQVLYQIYTRSFADSDGDGIGDLGGITARLDYLAWLGVGAIWLSPICPSPNDDWGYDVSDYYDVDPTYGTLEDLDILLAEADSRKIAVLLDLVPNHTSSAHTWFIDARSSVSSRHRNWYVWARSRPDGGPPNNWRSVFGGSAWTYDRTTESYYLHNFLPSQPDLNWWNAEVQTEFKDILRFWLGRGVAGFRIDVCYGLVKDKKLRDNPPATKTDTAVARRLGQRQVYNMHRPEVHKILQQWRRIANGYVPPRVLAGETGGDLRQLAAFFGAPERPELHLALDFPFIDVPLRAAALQATVAAHERTVPTTAWPTWQLSSHDTSRMATRWCQGESRKIRCGLMILLGLRGTPILYYGDELGMTDGDIDLINQLSSAKDVPRELSKRPSRLVARTPMQWTGGPNAGFTTENGRPWLPINTACDVNVDDQREDLSSTLVFSRDLVELRRRSTDISDGSYQPLPAPPDVWIWRRGTSTLIAINLSDELIHRSNVHGRVLLGTDRARDGQSIHRGLSLGPWEGVVISENELSA